MRVPPVVKSRRLAPARVARAAVAAGVLLPLLAGCSLLEGPTPDIPKREAPAKPETAPELVPDGTADDNLPFFREVLTTYAAGDGAVQGQPIVEALAAAGFDKTLMQVSFDRTKTDLVADNIFVSVRIGKECLIGQVVTADRSVVAENEPAIGPDQTVCLIGETAPIG